MNTIRMTLPEFLSSGDEESFFAWLERIPAFKSSRGVGEDLIIEVSDIESDDDSLRELIALFVRHQMDASSLRDLVSDQNRSWFKDNPHSYWNRYVFGGKKRSGYFYAVKEPTSNYKSSPGMMRTLKVGTFLPKRKPSGSFKKGKG